MEPDDHWHRHTTALSRSWPQAVQIDVPVAEALFAMAVQQEDLQRTAKRAVVGRTLDPLVCQLRVDVAACRVGQLVAATDRTSLAVGAARQTPGKDARVAEEMFVAALLTFLDDQKTVTKTVPVL